MTCPLTTPHVQEVYRLQLRCFLGLIMEQRHLPALKLLLKLYTTISLPKLAGLMDMDEASVRAQLLLLKVCTEGLSQRWSSVAAQGCTDPMSEGPRACTMQVCRLMRSAH